GLAWTFAKQGLFKHFLTEGDKILSVAFITTAIQGDYSLVEKYGSIIARLLFQPIEEMSRVFFSKTLPSSTASAAPPSKENALKALTLLTLLLRLYVLLSLYFLAFGTNYTALLIDLLASRQFSIGSAPAVFSAYCLYIPLMAINGVTEAFLQSVAPKDVLMRQSGWMAVCWAVFFASGWIGIQLCGLGGVGVVLANSVNMVMRVWFSWGYVGEYFAGFLKSGASGEKDVNEKEDKMFKDGVKRMLNPLELLPKSLFLWAAFGLGWAVTYASNEIFGWDTLKAKAQHIGVGVVMFLIASVVT
ncbi:Oligosaccharide translocation protein rft1, partial [Rhizoclosmatium sp. JEL0117]